jgi:hypothetical protein
MIRCSSWSEIKDFIDNSAAVLRYVELESNYELLATDTYFTLQYSLDKYPSDTADLDEFEANYKDNANKTLLDPSGRVLSRNATTDAGWKLLALYSSLETSIYGGGYYCKDINNTSINLLSYHYNASNVLLNNQTDVDSSCVRTDFVYKFGVDIDLDSGWITQNAQPSEDLYLWGAFGALNAGTVVSVTEFVRCLNLFHLKDDHYIDGKSTKKLYNDLGIGLECNQGLIRLRHSVGYKHKFQMNIGYYRS